MHVQLLRTKHQTILISVHYMKSVPSWRFADFKTRLAHGHTVTCELFVTHLQLTVAERHHSDISQPIRHCRLPSQVWQRLIFCDQKERAIARLQRFLEREGMLILKPQCFVDSLGFSFSRQCILSQFNTQHGVTIRGNGSQTTSALACFPSYSGFCTVRAYSGQLPLSKAFSSEGLAALIYSSAQCCSNLRLLAAGRFWMR